ncbi:oxidoreductase [Paracoccus mutanolyticus]|uniref:Oxidoreductase n=1 Tax=Paracoccus mutanolyticus TaxID=1499308 RepID=A0ABN5M851_9RHOB|nr:NAD(P)-dependent oxidoreductase [Paracoccus mutanolyticus]AWX94124.1 oxidoreductase [Paracoccus mutanolyticus]
MARVAFLGLGVMGFPMAGHLAAAGHQVTVWNRTAAKAEAWAGKHTGRAAGRARRPRVHDYSAKRGIEACFILAPEGAPDWVRDRAALWNAAEARETRKNSVTARECGLGLWRAGSGGQAGAENGQLSVMCGGTPEDYARAEPVIAAYARICRLMGPSGAGQLTKMCNQIAIAGLVQGLSESLHFAEKAGLSISEVVEVISQGAAGSWQMQNRHKTMEENRFDFGFAVDWMRKDLGICLAAANENGASLPVTALVDQFYKDVQNMGGGRWDTSSLIARLRK